MNGYPQIRRWRRRLSYLLLAPADRRLVSNSLCNVHAWESLDGRSDYNVLLRDMEGVGMEGVVKDTSLQPGDKIPLR